MVVFTMGPAIVPRCLRCVVVVLSGGSRALVVGGSTGGDYASSTELLSFGTMTFEPGPQIPSPRSCCAAVVLDAHGAIVIGGRSITYFATTEVLDTGAMTFAPGPSMHARRCE